MFYHLKSKSIDIGIKLSSDEKKAREELTYIYKLLNIEAKYKKEIEPIFIKENWFKKGNLYTLVLEVDLKRDRIQFFFQIKTNFNFITNQFGECIVEGTSDKRYDGFRKFIKPNVVNGFLCRRKLLINKYELN